MAIALSVTIGAVIFAALLLVVLFRYLNPTIVRDDYVTCSGGWNEAKLNNCQAGLLAVPQQPVNTYSNLAYFATGLFPGILLDTPASYVFAFTMAYLCLGSALFHAISTRWAGMLDVTAIYTVFSALATYAAAVLLDLPEWLIPGLMFLVAAGIVYVLSPRYKRRMRLIIGIFLGGAYLLVLLQMWLSGNWSFWPYLLASFITFVLAFIFWNMDKAGTFPLPRWGHGIWHILTAAASGLVFYSIYGSSL